VGGVGFDYVLVELLGAHVLGSGRGGHEVVVVVVVVLVIILVGGLVVVVAVS
jgi:hypothetical protein